jgi:hypothetical protein
MHTCKPGANGPLCERAPMGDGARRLQRRWRRLEYFPMNMRAAAPIAGARMVSAASATQSSAVYRRCALERQGSDPEGAHVRPQQPPGQSRRGCERSSTITSTQCRPIATRGCSTNIRRRNIPTTGWFKRTLGAAGRSPNSRSSIPASSMTTATSMSISSMPRRVPRTSSAAHRSQSRARRGNDPCTASALVPE